MALLSNQVFLTQNSLLLKLLLTTTDILMLLMLSRSMSIIITIFLLWIYRRASRTTCNCLTRSAHLKRKVSNQSRFFFGTITGLICNQTLSKHQQMWLSEGYFTILLEIFNFLFFFSIWDKISQSVWFYLKLCYEKSEIFYRLCYVPLLHLHWNQTQMKITQYRSCMLTVTQ